MISRTIWALGLSTALMGTAFFAHALQTSNDTNAEPGATEFSAPADAWRDVEPENLLVIETKYGNIGIELYPEIAPKHVEQVKALARQEFYDNVPFHRVIAGFMNQTGDGSNQDGTGDSELPNIDAEFTFRRGSNISFSAIAKKRIDRADVGVAFYKALPIASQPSSQALFTKDGKVDAHGLHCKGVTSMARTNDPMSANSQFFLMRGENEGLNTNYSIWGATVMGLEHVEKPLVGTVGEKPGWMPDYMKTVRVASDLPAADQPSIQVLRVEHSAFQAWLDTQRDTDGALPDICDLAIPTRVQ